MFSTLALKYEKFRNLLQIVLFFLILLFCFFVSFNPSIGKTLINNMFYIWLLTLNFKNIFYYLKSNKIFLLIVVFFVWISFSTFITPTTNYYNYDNFVKYFLLPILIISTSIKTEYIKYLIISFIGGMFINELISYGIYFELIKEKFLGFSINGNKSNPVPFLTSHIEYTQFLSLTAIMSLFAIFKLNNKFIRLILIVFLITMVTNLFLTTGRTGQFTLLMTSIFLIIIYFKNNIKYIFYSFLTLSIVFILGFNFSSNVNTRIKQGFNDIEKVIKEKDYNTSWGIRLTSYIIIPDIIKNEKFSLLYGFGYCAVDKEIQQIQTKVIGDYMKSQYGHLHNTYITIFAALGLIGLIIFLMIWYYLFKAKIEDSYLSYVRYTFLLVVTFGGFSSELFWQREVMLLSAIFISIIIYVSSKNEKERLNA
ncbi:O-antigen ligase family protein [Aliarcobacter cryaerophilus]|uniref:O-antigen ligase family protein n=1 Tax=Aliarcobacter cryaerophilus TaxID=28198 RepID=UPI0021B69037|nr:O-antigen ligase family protein [Aliarcobacter cryaerophilus]MCT7533300.1 O-antigen ligase family protein [Aliarcobacter cryaerophilus]